MNCIAKVVLPVPVGPGEHQRIPGRDAAAHHLVQPGDAGRQPARCDAGRRRARRSGVRGKTWTPASVIRMVCSPGIGAMPRIFTT